LADAMVKELMMKRVMEEPDFVKCSKYGNSLVKYLSGNSGEIKDKTIARLLMIAEDDVERIYQEAVDILRRGVV